jgi:hypothetical protein
MICVRYTNALNNSLSDPTFFTVYQYNASASYGQQFDNVTSDFSTHASVSNVTFSQSPNSSAESVDVNYTLTAPSNANTSAPYGIFILQFCSLFPMVVVPNGTTITQLSTSEFSAWYPHEGSCPAQEMNAQVIGVSGFSVVPAT